MNLCDFLEYVEKKPSDYSLLVGDTNQIHAYIFETSKLPEIRGASNLLIKLITEDFDRIFDEHFVDASSRDEIEDDTIVGYKIYNHAGSCMAIASTSGVEGFINDVTERFHRETGAVTITFVYAPLTYLNKETYFQTPQGEISKWMVNSNRQHLEGNIRLLGFLRYKLEVEKRKKSYYPFVESNSIVRRCDHCGKRPAIHKWEYGSETEYICSTCTKKRSHGEKSSIMDGMAKKDNFWHSCKGKIPRDLDTLAGSSNNIGIIYADGNEMGRMLFEARDLTQFKSRSKEIEDSIHDSLCPLLKERIHGNTLPFEILNMAGDDIIMIIQAEYIMEFSLNLLTRFEEMCSEYLHENITMSLGATIFKAKYPVQYAFEITNSLLKSAKRYSKQNIDKPRSTLSYLYMKAPIAALSCEEIMHSFYDVSDKALLTMRPYTCDEFKVLLEAAKDIERNNVLTNSQIGAISRAFYENSLYSATNFTKYQITRMDKAKKKLLLSLIRDLKQKFDLEDVDGSDELPLWGRRTLEGKEVIATPFLDIFEILEISGGGLFEKSLN